MVFPSCCSIRGARVVGQLDDERPLVLAAAGRNLLHQLPCRLISTRANRSSSWIACRILVFLFAHVSMSENEACGERAVHHPLRRTVCPAEQFVRGRHLGIFAFLVGRRLWEAASRLNRHIHGRPPPATSREHETRTPIDIALRPKTRTVLRHRQTFVRSVTFPRRAGT